MTCDEVGGVSGEGTIPDPSLVAFESCFQTEDIVLHISRPYFDSCIC